MTQSLISYAAETFAALSPIASPVGAIPIFYSLTAADSPRYRSRQAQKTTLNVMLVLAVSYFTSRTILNFFWHFVRGTPNCWGTYCRPYCLGNGDGETTYHEGRTQRNC